MSAQTNQGTSSAGPKESLELLESRADDVSDEIDGWNTWNIRFVIAGLLFAGAVFVTQFMVIHRSRELAKNQKEIIREKDRISSEKIAEAKRDADNARLETEKLKMLLSWREITSEQATRIIEVAASFPRKVVIEIMASDPEALSFAEQLRSALRRANWDVARQSRSYNNRIVSGVFIPKKDEGSILIQKAFVAAGIAFSSDEPPAQDMFSQNSWGENLGGVTSETPVIFVAAKPRSP